MYVVEFQKRGLPHAHILIWLDSASKLKWKVNVDNYVSAEIPDPLTDPVGYDAIKSFMMQDPVVYKILSLRAWKISNAQIFSQEVSIQIFCLR